MYVNTNNGQLGLLKFAGTMNCNFYQTSFLEALAMQGTKDLSNKSQSFLDLNFWLPKVSQTYFNYLPPPLQISSQKNYSLQLLAARG